jgi:hypothetical protein
MKHLCRYAHAYASAEALEGGHSPQRERMKMNEGMKNEGMKGFEELESLRELLPASTEAEILEGIEELRAETASQKPLLEWLSEEQKSALEKKYAALAPEIQEGLRIKYEGLSLVEAYALRQLSKEANAALFSSMKAVWIAQIVSFAPSLGSSSIDLRKRAESILCALRDEIPAPKIKSILLDSKKKLFMHSMNLGETASIFEALCAIFEVSSKGVC